MPVSGARETVSVFEHWGQKRSISFCWCCCWVGGQSWRGVGILVPGEKGAALTWLTGGKSGDRRSKVTDRPLGMPM